MSQITPIEEADATGEIAELYEEIQRDMGIPFVPNIDKYLAIAPNTLKGTWAAVNHVFLQTNLPMSLAAMILFTVSTANECAYCGPLFKATCMSAGIDQETLAALESDLQGLSPRRVQAIVEFAKKCATDRASLGDDDFENVRDQGVNDEEIVEIITLAALGNYLNTIADSLKIGLDDAIAQALSG